jgi:hypothetical protein
VRTFWRRWHWHVDDTAISICTPWFAILLMDQAYDFRLDARCSKIEVRWSPDWNSAPGRIPFRREFCREWNVVTRCELRRRGLA